MSLIVSVVFFWTVFQIFMSTHREKESPLVRPYASGGEGGVGAEEDGGKADDSGGTTPTTPHSGVDVDTDIVALSGAWGALAGGATPSDTVPRGTALGQLPNKFNGLATPEKNPMSMQLSHEDVVVGCADGTI
jgi:pyrimidine and pyridine-specific 5'-nucleotidase